MWFASRVDARETIRKVFKKEKDMTFGEKACGVSFNPGGNPLVEEIKRDYAAIVDKLENLRQESSKTRSQDGDVRRMLSLAVDQTQMAQMWAVKAVAWNH